MSPRIAFIALCTLLAVTISSNARTFYVATNGNDNWSGSYPQPLKSRKDGPLASLAQAVRRTHEFAENGARQIVLRDGIFVLDEPILLTSADTGLTIAAYRNENPVISGQSIIANWSRVAGSANLWHAQISELALKAWNFRELFVNGDRRQRARTPNDGFFHLVGANVAPGLNKAQYRRNDINPAWTQSGEVELVTLQLWAGSRNRIRSVDTNSHVVTLGGDAFAENKEKNGRYYIENSRDALDQPGEWFFDSKKAEVFYWPKPAEDLASERITVPHLSELIVLNGSKAAPVSHVMLKGLTFADADWRLPTNGYCDIQSACDIHGAVRGEFANECIIEKCEFTRLGGYAVDFGRGCMRERIIGNIMHDLGGGGVRLADPDLNISFQDPSGGHEVTDNHIYHIGRVYPPAVGILIFHSGGNHVAHNHIHDTYYTGISLGWQWGYEPVPASNNIVEYNHIHDIGQKMLSDMGGIYTLGLQHGTIIRNNLIHDVSDYAYGAWGLYADEGSSGIIFENNIVYRCASENAHQHYGKENIFRNNIFAFGGRAGIIRSQAENHIAFFLSNNIVYLNSGTIMNGDWRGTNVVVDHNLYFDTRTNGMEIPVEGNTTWAQWHTAGRDLHSLFADPLFLAPDKNDYRLNQNSPAFKLGFKPIDMRTVGVRKKFARKTSDETD